MRDTISLTLYIGFIFSLSFISIYIIQYFFIFFKCCMREVRSRERLSEVPALQFDFYKKICYNMYNGRVLLLPTDTRYMGYLLSPDRRGAFMGFFTLH
jgi:hypothetical protein